MRLNTSMVVVLADLKANRQPDNSDPSVIQSLRKRGLIVRDGSAHKITLTGEQALEQAQKGKK